VWEERRALGSKSNPTYALRKLIAEQMQKGNFKGGTFSYSLGGIQGIPKYLKDYSTILTFGKTGNLAVTYLGGYRVDVYITDVNFSNGQADVTFQVWNSSTLASAIRPPVFGYTKFYNQTIAPMINPSYGPLSEVTQSFWWVETISF
jgi:hypothetical protein